MKAYPSAMANLSGMLTSLEQVWLTLAMAQVEAGGEMIISQLFYDVDLFVKFVKDCRSKGITVPILPGACIRQCLVSYVSVLG